VKKSFSYDEAEELSGEMLKELYLSFLKTDQLVNPEGYVWRICQHVFAKYVNQKKLQKGLSLDANGGQLSYFDDYDFGQTAQALSRLRKEIGFLSSSRRQILYSFYYEGKSIVQIAKEQALPTGTVKWHLNKARNDLKEGFTMKREIGSLGLSPVSAINFSHNGRPGSNGGPEFYLQDKINLNLVYSVYEEPKTISEIAEDLGMTPVFLEDKIKLLVDNGFLVELKGGRYTTYVKFTPDKVSIEAGDKIMLQQLEAAKLLCQKYLPQVRKAAGEIKELYIPGGNRELFEESLVFLAICRKCALPIERDLSKYLIRTLDGGEYYATVNIKPEITDPEYKPKFNDGRDFSGCGEMSRVSEKYPAVFSWSFDSRFDNRKGAWQNNLTSDYEALYEVITKSISDTKSNSEKFDRLRERGFITKDGKINVMLVKGSLSDLLEKIPSPDKALLDEFAKIALDSAMLVAKLYPSQMQDFVIAEFVNNFIGNNVAMMVLDQLYDSATFRPLTEEEKVTANLLMFSDKLPE